MEDINFDVDKFLDETDSIIEEEVDKFEEDFYLIE